MQLGECAALYREWREESVWWSRSNIWTLGVNGQSHFNKTESDPERVQRKKTEASRSFR